MRLALPSLVLFMLPLACSFDSSGEPEVGSGGDDEADVTTGTPESGSEAGTDQGTSSSPDTSEGPDTSESTTDPTTESTTDDPTTESTSESTTDDPTTESTTDTTESTTDTTETTGGETPPYGSCNDDADCAVGEVCRDSGVEFLADPWKVCATPCASVVDCPDAGGAPLLCNSYYGEESCFIDCDNQDCPDGMACVLITLSFTPVCVWS